MNKQQEALRLALEALEETLRTLDDENAKPGGAISDTIWYSEHETLFDYLTTQIEAIREAMAEQQSGIKQVIELYDSPEQPAQQQEPIEVKQIAEALRQVGLTLVRSNGGFRVMDLGRIEAQTTFLPASKPWARLTEEERDYIWHTVGNSDAHGDVDGWSGRNVMDAIEAKLKEKNGF